MNRNLLTHSSIRTVLFSVLLILGGWGIVGSLLQVYSSYQHYRQSENLSEWSLLAEELLTAAQHISFERGRTTVVLRGTTTIPASDRAFIDKRRALADSSLKTALDGLVKLPDSGHSELQAQWDNLQRFRMEADRNAEQPLPARDAGLPDRWFGAATDLLQAIQSSVEALVGHFPPGDQNARLSLLAAALLDLRVTSGAEASVVAQLRATGRTPDNAHLLHVYQLRGKEDQLWHDIERLASYTRAVEFQHKIKKVKNHHLSVLRPLQNQTIADLTTQTAPSVSLQKLTVASVPTLDGIAELMTLATDKARRDADEGMSRSRNVLVRNSLVLLMGFLVLILSLRYVLCSIISPLEHVDREVRRLGAIPPSHNDAENEIDRISAATIALEKSLCDRAEAEAKLRQTIEELQTAFEQIKTLKGFLPICASCKKIRNDKGYWEQVESYITSHSDAQFSHGICPDCVQQLYGDLLSKKTSTSIDSTEKT
jgi:hypothetical protein